MKGSLSPVIVFIGSVLFALAVYIAGFSRIAENLNGLLLLIFMVFSVSCGIALLFWRQSQKNEEERQGFITTINHIFRTPLTEMRWAIEDLEQKGVSSDVFSKSVSTIKTSNKRLLDIFEAFEGLTKYDKRGAYSFRAVAFHELIEGALALHKHAAKERDISLSVDSDTNLPLVTVDTQKLRFAIEVLIENAIRYSKKGGHIEINTRQEGNMVVVEVLDNGIGIEPRFLPHIFSAFSRGDRARQIHPNGMGLGLHLARKIVKQHKGDIRIKSKKEGVDAKILLPIG